MDIDKSIQEILQRSLPVNDNRVVDEDVSSANRTTAKKSDIQLESINIVGNQNIIISTNLISILIFVLSFCVYLLK